jgi:tetratricopeptide (TPR) repeat protein
MKKLTLLFVSMFIGASMFYGQSGSPDNLFKARQKSDEEIQDVKKKDKSATWEKRGDLFLEMAQFNTKDLIYGMQPLLVEQTLKKPKDIKKSADGEDWIYDRVTLHFANQKLESWDETQPLDVNALYRSIAAYDSAVILDPKGKVKTKNSVKENIAKIRDLLVSQGAKSYYVTKNFPQAFKDLEMAVKLYDYPRMSSDTSFQIATITLHVARAAVNSKDYKNGEKYYNLCIEKEYNKGEPYNELAAFYGQQKEKDKQIDIIEKGFKKYPDSKEILYAYINFYFTYNQQDKALEKIDVAIKGDPENPTLYHAKAAIFDNIVQDTSNRYTEAQKAENFEKAVTNYKKAIEVKPEYFEANFNLGVLYYNGAVHKIKIADSYKVNQVKEFNDKIAEAEEYLKLALPYMEKAYKIDSKDRSVIQDLILVYRRLKQYDKAKEMQGVFDNLPAQSNGM